MNTLSLNKNKKISLNSLKNCIETNIHATNEEIEKVIQNGYIERGLSGLKNQNK